MKLLSEQSVNVANFKRSSKGLFQSIKEPFSTKNLKTFRIIVIVNQLQDYTKTNTGSVS
jgi:hypothetical protein